MMVGKIQPLDKKFPIINTNDGRPTDYFIRWAQQRQIDISKGIDAEQAQELVNDYALFNYLLENLGGDPGADRILFWDDSEDTFRFLKLGTNLSISGDILNATGGGGGGGDSFLPLFDGQTDSAPVVDSIGQPIGVKLSGRTPTVAQKWYGVGVLANLPDPSDLPVPEGVAPLFFATDTSELYILTNTGWVTP
jgi:hypothetical protein